MLVEIHVLQNLAPSNPNRDDVGAPKSAVFGGTPRGRISSQCQKRSIRLYPTFKDNEQLKQHLGTRTKFFPDLVGEELRTSKIPEAERGRVVLACTRIAKAEESSVKSAAEEDRGEKRARTPQLIYIDPAHVAEFVGRLERLRNEMKAAYDFYLNPVAGFQEVMAAALAEVELDDSAKAAVTKNAWVIAKLRLPQLRQFEGEDQPDEPPTADEPSPETAKWIAGRLQDLSVREEKENKDLFKNIQKAADRQEKAQLKEAEPEKPKDYAKFQDQLFEPLKSSAVDIALFGRMTTSDAFEDVEACLEVAHALSTNEMAREVDYFTAVDDLGTGVAAAHVGENQFTSNCYYKYFSLDWTAFVKQLAGGKNATPESKAEQLPLARTALKELIRAAVCAIPSGKKKGHANNNPPDAVLVEVKEKRIPTSYANAFLRPVVPADGDGDLMKGSIRKLGHYAGTVCGMYGLKPSRFWLHREGEPLVVVRTGGGKEPQKPETLADSQPDLDAMLDAVVKAIPPKEGK